MSKFDQKMSEFFDVEPTSPNTDVVKTNSTEVIPHETLDVDFKNDYIKVRDNMHELIETGKGALESILAVAQDSEKSRDYEVAANLLKTVLDANEQMINIHKKVRDIANYKKAIASSTDVNGQTNIQNAVFVGSTSELSKMIKQMREKDITEADDE
jgi:hypothetical protein